MGWEWDPPEAQGLEEPETDLIRTDPAIERAESAGRAQGLAYAATVLSVAPRKGETASQYQLRMQAAVWQEHLRERGRK